MLALPSFIAPVYREILTVSTAYTVRVTAPDDTAVDFYVDGAYVAAMTFTGGYWQYSYTPGTVAAREFTAVGNVTGTSAAHSVVVAEANSIQTNMALWSKTNTTITVASVNPPIAGLTVWEVKPTSSGTASRLFSSTPSTTPTVASHGFEIWVGLKPGSTVNVLALTNGGTAYYDFLNDGNRVTGGAGGNYSCVVETKTAADGTVWKRIQTRKRDDAAAPAATTMFLYLMNDITIFVNNVNIAPGDLAAAGIYVTAPRFIGSVKIPFTINEKMIAYLDPTATAALGVAGAEQYVFSHPYINTEAGIGGAGGGSIQLIKPAGWTSAGRYPLLLFLRALSDSTETGVGHPSTWQTASDAAADYANRYNCIVALFTEYTTGYWAGIFADGRANVHDFIPHVLVPWLSNRMAVSPLRNDRIFLGYSKSGNVAIRQLLMFPDVVGFAGSGDGAFLNVYPANNANLNYDVKATYDAQDPAQILSSYLSSVNDGKRISIRGGYTWNADYAAFTAQLTAAGVQHDSLLTAWTYHGWGPTGINTGWTPLQVAELFAMRAAMLGDLPSFTWSNGIIDFMHF